MNALDAGRIFGSAALFALLATTGWGEPPAKTRRKPQAERPANAKPSRLAQRLCDALQALPARRKSECCGTSAPSSSLAGVCSQELSASLARGAVTLDAAAIDRCTADTSRQLEGCEWVTPLSPKPPDACRNLVQGQLKTGAACHSSLECRDGLFCRGVEPGKVGVCAKPAPARTRCETSADSLVSFTRAEGDSRHLACEGVCIKGQCLPFVSPGGACQSSAACTPGLHCIAGRCQDQLLPRIGESCAGSTSCSAGAYCQAGLCAALKSAGEACALPVECRALACVVGPGSSVGKCGEPCGSSLGKPVAPAH